MFVSYVNTFAMPEQYTKPFKGIVYNKEKIGDITPCVCPPYDVISDVRSYFKRSDFNAIRLELPQSLPSMDKYNAARQTMDMWFDEGIIKQDVDDTVYIMEQEFDFGGTTFLRRGFIALNKLDRERILTHEETRKKAKEDRERLITTLKTYTSLIFGLYEDKNNEIEYILINSKKETIYDFIDEQSIRNRFYRMKDSNEISRLTGLMDKRHIYIADGHHRLDVSYRLGISFIPIYLTNMYSSGIVILPYHRIIKFNGARNIEDILHVLSNYGVIEGYDLTDSASMERVMKDITESERLAFAFCSKDKPDNIYEFIQKTPVPMDKDLHEVLKTLKVNVVHKGVIKDILGIADEEISFTQDYNESLDALKRGSLDLAIFLPPTTVQEVKDIADNNLVMPPKSTFFYPKILTGLVFYKYA